MKLRTLSLMLILLGCSAAALSAQEPLELTPPEAVPLPSAPPPSGLIDMPGLSEGPNADDEIPPDREDRMGYVNLEFLLWWVKNPSVPTLVTGGDVLDTVPGAAGQPGTFPLLNNTVHLPVSAGGRLTAFRWLNDNQVFGVEATAFAVHLESHDIFRSNATRNEPVIARPFFNVNLDHADADPVGLPFAQVGQLDVIMPSTILSGELNFHLAPAGDSSWQYRYLAGPRYLQLDERLTIKQYSVELADGQINYVQDEFGTKNRFYGGQIGVGAEYRGGRLLLGVRSKLGFGMTEQRARAEGGTALTQPDGTVNVVNDRGLLVQPFNAGIQSKKRAFSIVPEVTFNAGLQLSEYLSLYMGYNFLYWTHVVRPGDAMSKDISLQPCCPEVFLGAHAPQFNPTDSSIWLQGLNFGLEINF